MENSIWNNAYFCVNLVWAVTVLLSVAITCFCVCYSLKKYFEYEKNKEEKSLEKTQNEFNKRFDYERELNSNQHIAKDMDLNRSIREKIAVAIIEKVKDSDVDLESAITKVDDLKSKLLEHTITEQ